MKMLGEVPEASGEVPGGVSEGSRYLVKIPGEDSLRFRRVPIPVQIPGEDTWWGFGGFQIPREDTW